MSKISLCMICKNEEDLLPGCLESAAPAVDEIVIVDTGSADATVKIGQDFGATVIQAPWVDFSDARNRALDAATGDWVLSLDADEELVVESPDKLRVLVASEGVDEWLARIVHVVEVSEFVDVDRSPQIFIVRLFKKAGAHWVNPIHEQVVLPAGAKTGVADGVDIIHYGYLKDIFADRGKSGRNKDLLIRWLAEQPDDPMPHFYLANQVRAEGDYALAVKEYETALPGLVESKAPACAADAFKFLADCYEKLGRDDEVLPLLERGVSVYADCAELQYVYGCRLLDSGRASAAIDCFRTCLKLVEGSPKYSANLRGVGNWRTLERLAAAFRFKGRQDKALISLHLASAIAGQRLVGPADICSVDLNDELRAAQAAIYSDPVRSVPPVIAWLMDEEPDLTRGELLAKES